MELKLIFNSNKNLFDLIKYVSYKMNGEEMNIKVSEIYKKQAELLLK